MGHLSWTTRSWTADGAQNAFGAKNLLVKVEKVNLKFTTEFVFFAPGTWHVYKWRSIKDGTEH